MSCGVPSWWIRPNSSNLAAPRVSGAGAGCVGPMQVLRRARIESASSCWLRGLRVRRERPAPEGGLPIRGPDYGDRSDIDYGRCAAVMSLIGLAWRRALRCSCPLAPHALPRLTLSRSSALCTRWDHACCAPLTHMTSLGAFHARLCTVPSYLGSRCLHSAAGHYFTLCWRCYLTPCVHSTARFTEVYTVISFYFYHLRSPIF